MVVDIPFDRAREGMIAHEGLIIRCENCDEAYCVDCVDYCPKCGMDTHVNV